MSILMKLGITGVEKSKNISTNDIAESTPDTAIGRIFDRILPCLLKKIRTLALPRVRNITHIFFHPDFTVGIGIAPIHALSRSRTVTAGREFHPAPKTIIQLREYYSMLRYILQANLF
jgi:hypothetical protein